MTRTILVVDDDPDIRDLLHRTLTRDGYRPVLAANGWEGLLAFDHEEQIDAVLLDILMPGLDGPKFLNILRRIGRDRVLPVIVISVLSEPDVNDRIGGDLVQGYVPKGRIDDVLTNLRHLFGEVGGGGAN